MWFASGDRPGDPAAARRAAIAIGERIRQDGDGVSFEFELDKLSDVMQRVLPIGA